MVIPCRIRRGAVLRQGAARTQRQNRGAQDQFVHVFPSCQIIPTPGRAYPGRPGEPALIFR